jgi:ATP-binding cassette subfamily C (CFTR/MRP) protein 4
MAPLLRLGAVQQVAAADLFPLPTSELSDRCTRDLIRAWERQQRRPNNAGSFLMAVLWTYPWDYFWVFLGYAGEAACRVVQAYLVGQLVKLISEQEALSRGLLLAGTLTLTNFCQALLHQLAFYLSGRFCYILRLGAMGLIHHKGLALSMQSQTRVTTGHIVNLVSNDVERFMVSLPYLPYLIISPVQLAVILYLLWGLVGAYAFCGAAVFLAFLPLHIYTSHVFALLRMATAGITDQRVKVRIPAAHAVVRVCACACACVRALLRPGSPPLLPRR